MKEIKAYVRLAPLAQVIDRLEEEGARDLTVTHVHANGALADTEEECLQRKHTYRNQYADIARVEIVCADGEVERFVNALKEASVSGTHDDGRIFVLNIEQAVCLGADGENHGCRDVLGSPESREIAGSGVQKERCYENFCH